MQNSNHPFHGRKWAGKGKRGKQEYKWDEKKGKDN